MLPRKRTVPSGLTSTRSFPFCATRLRLDTRPRIPLPDDDRSAMSWISWTSLVPTLLILSASLAWWFTEPKNARINLIAAAGLALFCWAVAPDLSRNVSYSVYASSVDAVAALRLDLFIIKHANMLLTGTAVVWYVVKVVLPLLLRCFSHCHLRLEPPRDRHGVLAKGLLCVLSGWCEGRGKHCGSLCPS